MSFFRPDVSPGMPIVHHGQLVATVPALLSCKKSLQSCAISDLERTISVLVCAH